ncbi:hypothetical protein [Pseudomonas fluorescens]|uniref:Uncharacterized protein n=1 Tax=Pseudomonas fluorescens TaxID=294 RepID=A0A0F4VEU8_PSEFL|nr:hypothetical protein [Pseudomonas fluorescens]KJZ67249.1 hypothetical protein VD17_03020 [Pseudomonas fluorescens]
MNLTQHLEDLKAEIEKIESKPKVELFSGTLSDETLKSIKLDGGKSYVLLGCAGGPIPEKRIRLEVDAVYGAFVIAKSDQDTKGLSRQAMNVANEIAVLIDKYRGNTKTNTNLPMLQSIEELFSGLKNGSNFSAWQVIWTQRVALV